MRKADGSTVELPSCYGVTLEPGERMISHSAGGGGYGQPLERDPLKVLHDVREGWVSPARARDTYGVSLVGDVADDSLDLDVLATAANRKA